MTMMQIKDRRTVWAQKRSHQNAQNKHLNDNQHRAISMLAFFRHNFHCDMGCLYYPESGAYKKFSNFFTNTLPTMLRVAGLPNLNLNEFFANSINSYEDSLEIGEMINDSIENYLAGIDFLYGTWYAPCGFTRELVAI